MARRPIKGKQGQSWDNVDWSEVESAAGRIPEGDYQFRIKSTTLKMSKNDNEMLDVTVLGLTGKAKGKIFHIFLSRLPQTLWKLGSFLEAIGMERTSSIPFEDMVDREFVGVVADDT